MLASLCACGGAEDPAPIEHFAVVVSFNSGTTEKMSHDGLPDDGYGSEQALISDTYYGDGLAWLPVVEDTRRFFAQTKADIVAFQEVFHSPDCADIPASAHKGFVCETWTPSDPTVALDVLGPDWQLACNLGKTDKCAAVNRKFGSFRGCDTDLCIDGLDGAKVEDCGKGSRIGRGIIDLVAGGTLTLVNVHGSSGIAEDDQNCRVKQFEQIFVDLGTGDGEPAANGERNIIMGDLNTDPGRMDNFDPSAQLFNAHVGDGKKFHFITEVGEEAPASYANVFNIDHVVSDAFDGSCWIAGLSSSHPAVSDVLYFDHKPVVCAID